MLYREIIVLCSEIRRHAMAHVVEVLGYKLEVREFDSRLCHCGFSLTWPFRPHNGPGVDSISNINKYKECSLGGKNGRCLGMTTLPLSCVDCHEILGDSTSCSPQCLSRPVMGCLYLYLYLVLRAIGYKT